MPRGGEGEGRFIFEDYVLRFSISILKKHLLI